MKIFEEALLGKTKLKNRIIRSATYEGMCDENARPLESYKKLYSNLSNNNIGGIITGFAYVSKEGKAMQVNQAGIDSPDLVQNYKEITDDVHNNNSIIFMQIMHAGRQTLHGNKDLPIMGVSPKSSAYYKQKPVVLKTNEVYELVDKFANSALLAREAGFDGIQLHGAHGYLIHQFLLPCINNRKDEFGIDKETGLGTKFLELIINKIKLSCPGLTLLIKISAGVDLNGGFSETQFVNLIKFLDIAKVDGIEISYGTMDYALNIIRGEIPVDLILKENPIYKINNAYLRKMWKSVLYPIMLKKFKAFTPMYNLEYAYLAKKHTSIPIICVGGFRKGSEIKYAVEEKGINFVSLSRPFICEEDFVTKLKLDENYESKCCNCNFCSIMCDTKNPTRCYRSSV